MQQFVDNRYRVVGFLGSGGMAEVYLAFDELLDRDVALKVLKDRYAQDEEFIKRFGREARHAAALSHPNIVSFYDRGRSEDGTYYIAMEYVPGGTLKERIMRDGPLSPHAAATVALRAAEALGAAHRHGLTHRDVKPQNILMTGSGNDAKVGDFGIARAESSDSVTQTGIVMGTAHYISPEQAMGEPVGPRSDLYSLGVVLYEMLTGALPYDAETSIGVAMKHVNGPPRSPREANPNVPEELDSITGRLLAKDPADRYPGATELVEDLERVGRNLLPNAPTTRISNRAASAAVSLDPGNPTGRTRALSVAPAPPARPVHRAGAQRGQGKSRRLRHRAAVSALLVATTALLAVFGWGLDLPGQEDAPLTVPSVRGMTLDEAERIMGSDFDLAVGDTRNSEQPEDTILGQDPGPEEGVPRGSTVRVTVSDGPAEQRNAARGGKLERKIQKLEKKQDARQEKSKASKDRKA